MLDLAKTCLWERSFRRKGALMHANRQLLTLLITVLASSWTYSSCVILLHGLVRTDRSMLKMEEALVEEGYHVINRSYPSRDHPIKTLATLAITPALESCSAHGPVNFVTHSLGGILVRQYLSTHNIRALKRVVMLGPPNQGSEAVDQLGDLPGFHYVFGEAGLQLGTGPLSTPNRLGSAHFDVGIIAGTRSINGPLSMLIPGADDGAVALARTHLTGMNDHMAMPVTHSFMMQNKAVIAQVIFYLEHGHFKRDAQDATKSIDQIDDSK